MSTSNRLRLVALATACFTLPAFAADGVQVFPKTLPLADAGATPAAKAQLGAMPSPTMFEIQGELDEHGHVRAQCHEVRNPKADSSRVREPGRGVVKQEQPR